MHNRNKFFTQDKQVPKVEVRSEVLERDCRDIFRVTLDSCRMFPKKECAELLIALQRELSQSPVGNGCYKEFTEVYKQIR